MTCDSTLRQRPRGRLKPVVVAMSLLGVTALAACGGSSTKSDATGAAAPVAATTSGGLPAVVPGTSIPTKTVKFGMAPFGDGSFYVIAMRNHWFGDVGIDVQPQPSGVEVTPDNVVQKMLTGEADVATFFGPGKIANLAKASQLKMFGFSDTYLGNYLLASPNSGAKPVAALVKSGVPFAQAIKQTMAAVKGQSVAFTNSGQHRDFLQGIFTLGGLKLTDVKATATNDARILGLANGGQVKFASPEGAAQNVELLNQGWIPLVSTADLLDGLPPGDKRAVASIGHEGPAASDAWLKANHDTALRFLSVMFRTIDAIKKDPVRYLPDQTPYLSSRSGIKVSVAQLKTVLGTNDPLVPFEQQTEFWTKLDGPRSYKSVYSAQIASAQQVGVIPKGKAFTPDDAIVGKQYYDELVALKKAYDDLDSKAPGLSGAKAALAAKAKTQYEHRNYLDAYRLLKAAVGG
jgi:ABC-type nitrate/sulfonate/bicarbonate transport system substrate-binding protein